MRDVDCSAAETAFAIHEVIAPEVMEFLGEAAQRTVRNGRIVAPAPALEGLGIVGCEALAIAPPEAIGRILLKKAFTLEQMGEPEEALITLAYV